MDYEDEEGYEYAIPEQSIRFWSFVYLCCTDDTILSKKGLEIRKQIVNEEFIVESSLRKEIYELIK